jgi:shikimate dehydrogenase
VLNRVGLRRLAVIGSPIGHSLSPAIHRAALRQLGLDWSYQAIEQTPATLPTFIDGLSSDWRGLSVTMPCKAAILAYGRPDQASAALGVGNTLIFNGQPQSKEDSRVYNTDVLGFAKLLRQSGLSNDQSVVVWGAGATARSAIWALKELGWRRITVRARRWSAVEQLIDLVEPWGIELRAEPPGQPSIAAGIISTVPAAAAAGWLGDVDHVEWICDVIYDPWPTPLGSFAQRIGVPAASGLDLLASQAQEQVRLMTGHEVSVDDLFGAAVAALAHRQGLSAN